MLEAAVIGIPLSHSLSPVIFEFLASRVNAHGALNYKAIEVSPEGLETFANQLRSQNNFVGCNVTIPHKQKIILHLDELSQEALATGAVNVIKRQGQTLSGHNSDVAGISECIHQHKAKVTGQSVALWGAGGAARAAAFALGQLSAKEVFVINRDLQRAQELTSEIAKHFPTTQFQVFNEEGSLREPITLAINATSLGMSTPSALVNPFFETMAKLGIKPGSIAIDMVYKPLWTLFMQSALACNLRPVNGLEMLIYQALKTWEIWFGPLDFSIQNLGRELHVHLQKYLTTNNMSDTFDARPVFLTGFMGVGKSTVAANLAKRLSWQHVDTDQLVIEKSGMSIAQIFEMFGEAHFRKLEIWAVSHAASLPRTVVSLGGGALTSIDSQERIAQSGRLVFLDASPEILERRLVKAATKRPLLKNLSSEQKIQKIRNLLHERRSSYESADFKIKTDSLTAEQVSQKIIESLTGPMQKGILKDDA